MKISGVTLSSFQSNFLKELLGDTFMTDVRAEAHLAKVCKKYDVDVLAIVQAASKNFDAKNAEFKRLEAEEAAGA